MPSFIRGHAPLWPDPRVKPPFGAAEIDWGHPLSLGLVSCFILNDDSINPFDLASGEFAARVGDINIQPDGVISGAQGRYFRSNAKGYFDPVNDATRFNMTTEDFSIVVDMYAKQGSGVHQFPLWVARGVLNVDGWYVTTSEVSNPAFLRMITNQSGANQITSSQIITYDRLNRCVVTRSGSSVKFYIDGTEPSYSAVGTHINPATSSQPYRICGDPTGSTNQPTDGVDRVMFYKNRVLSVSDACWLFEEPYCFLRPIIRRRYWEPRRFLLGSH